MRISIDLPDSQATQLQTLADRLKVPAEQLVAAALRNLLARSEFEFERVSARVLEMTQDRGD